MRERKEPLGRPRRRWRVMLRWMFKNWDGGMDWIDVEDRGRWRAVVNAVMNLRFP
jgi:hypothetical protein